jgi:flagellar motor switch protein FliM
MQTQVARMMSVNEKTLCLSFEIRMPHCAGLLNLAFPAVVSNTILRRLTSDWARGRRHGPETRARMELAARRVQFGASLQLPSVRVTAHTIQQLQPGDILRLGLPSTTNPLWCVGGQPLATAAPAQQGNHRAARIEQRLNGSRP